jgi:methylenetetrahydrofolate dehydrogenase (NADP+)/methenyltetrahydrofolate cyclohydrolase
MALILDGKQAAQALRAELKERIAELGRRSAVPAIHMLRVGEREEDVFYEKSIRRSCELLGLRSKTSAFPAGVEADELIRALEAANADAEIHGVMLFRPLPAHLDSEAIARRIHPRKDVDCTSPASLGRLFAGGSGAFAPCTPEAVIELLKAHGIPIRGAGVVVAGRSMVVGRPLALLFLNEDATVTICHSRTKDLRELTRRADIVAAAVGRAKFMDEDYFGPHSVVIDVGINDDGGGICGDVDFDRVAGRVRALSPAVGGVGALTTTILMEHLVRACEDLSARGIRQPEGAGQ